MTVVSTARRLTTKKGRVIVTELETIDEILDFWRVKYDAIFGAEVRARRLWGANARTKSAPTSGEIETQIAARQVEWDEYVREQLADIATAE